MKNNKIFRCPFEIKGEKDDKILTISLGENKEQRLILMNKGFETFHSQDDLVALKFILPKGLREKCNSNKELEPLLILYQAELVAAELDWRLNPFMLYQGKTIPPKKLGEMIEETAIRNPATIAVAIVLSELMETVDFYAKNIREFSLFIEQIIHSLIKENKHRDIYLQDEKYIQYARFGANGVVFFNDREHPADKTKNRNLFNIVRTPFYPKQFGRYSEDIEIFFTREADFITLSKPARQKIREDSNKILQKYVLEITDISNDKQPSGLWVVDFSKEVLQ